MAFRVLIIGGTGQVGAAVVRALAAEPSCAEVVMVNRKAISLTADPRFRQVIVDTAAAQFPAEVKSLAQSVAAQGDPVWGASCVGVGTGSRKWGEKELKALEIGVVGGLPAVVTPEASRSLLCSRQRAVPQEAGFAMCGSWG
jgi:NAD(P)H-hydrate repair Nnr-like enzyme with NAD(P)H-hydrate dehydratase domain